MVYPNTQLSALPRFGTSSVTSPYNKYLVPAAYAFNKLTNLPTMFPSRQYRNIRPSSTVMRKKRTVKKSNSFKSKMLKSSVAYHRTSDTASATATLHGNLYTFGPTQNITQGTSISGRQGDSIYLEALKINGVYTTDTVAHAYSCRILVGFSGEEFTATSFTTSGFGVTQLFQPSTTNSLVINGIVNPKAFTTLYDETIDINSQISATADWQRFSCTVPLKCQFPYQSDASTFGKFKNLYVVAITSTLGGTNAVTVTGSVTLSTDLIFKNNT